MRELTLCLSMPPEKSQRVKRALSVEGNREIPRTEVSMTLDDCFRLHIRAKDTHALRAAVNSYIRWLSLALDVEEVIDNGS